MIAISLLLLITPWFEGTFSRSPGDPAGMLNNIFQDTIIYYPGTFRWDEGTVVQTSTPLKDKMLHYLDILDHSNVDFSASPESVVQLKLGGEMVQYSCEILVREDTIQVFTSTAPGMELAVRQLVKMKRAGEQNSPDYGLIYIRCGLYRFENF